MEGLKLKTGIRILLVMLNYW